MKTAGEARSSRLHTQKTETQVSSGDKVGSSNVSGESSADSPADNAMTEGFCRGAHYLLNPPVSAAPTPS